MARSFVALLALALLGCGSSGESPPATAAPSAVAPTPAAPTPATSPTGPSPSETPPETPRSAEAPAPTAAAPAEDVARPDWAERERRTFVFQGAARDDVTGVAIARGGTHVAVGSRAGFVTMIDAATGEVRASERIARSSDVWFDLEVVGDLALVSWWGNGGGGVELWRWRAGTRIDVVTLAGIDVDASRVALSPRGDRFVFGDQQAIRVGTTGNGRVTTSLEESHGGALSWPHASAIVEEIDDGYASRQLVRVMDPGTLAELWTAAADAVAIVRPAGDRVALLDGTDVVVRALPGGEERARLPHGLAGADRIAVSREGDRVVVSSDAASVVLVLAGGVRTEIPAGRALWVSPRNVLLEADDGSVRRWVLDRARLGALVAPPRVVADEYEDEPTNSVELDAAGTVVSARGARVEVVQPSGARHELAPGGEHSVWSVSVDPAHGGAAIGGRFGVQAWGPTGVRDSTCAGATLPLRVAWPEGRVVTDRECDLASGERPRSMRNAAFAVSDDARFVIESDGTFVDRASSRRVQLEGHSELFCNDGDDCSGSATIGPVGTAVVMQLYYGSEDGPLVHETTNGRRIATLPSGVAYGFAADGSWLAYAGTRTLRWLDLAGEAHATRPLVGSADAEEEPASESRALLAAAPDGRSIAWTPGNGHRVQVVSVSDGSEIAELSIGTNVLELRWSTSGSQLAIRTAHEIRIHDVAAGSSVRTLAAAHGNLQIACSERVLRWIRDAANGGLEVVDLGACGRAEQTLPSLAPGRQLVSIDEGIVRIVRLDDRSVLVLRTLREDAVRRHHFAHDAQGHWWTDEPATDASPVPAWVRHGDGRGGETTPLDPAMRRDDLLARFFAPG